MSCDIFQFSDSYLINGCHFGLNKLRMIKQIYQLACLINAEKITSINCSYYHNKIEKFKLELSKIVNYCNFLDKISFNEPNLEIIIGQVNNVINDIEIVYEYLYKVVDSIKNKSNLVVMLKRDKEQILFDVLNLEKYLIEVCVSHKEEKNELRKRLLESIELESSHKNLVNSLFKRSKTTISSTERIRQTIVAYQKEEKAIILKNEEQLRKCNQHSNSIRSIGNDLLSIHNEISVKKSSVENKYIEVSGIIESFENSIDNIGSNIVSIKREINEVQTKMITQTMMIKKLEELLNIWYEIENQVQVSKKLSNYHPPPMSIPEYCDYIYDDQAFKIISNDYNDTISSILAIQKSIDSISERNLEVSQCILIQSEITKSNHKIDLPNLINNVNNIAKAIGIKEKSISKKRDSIHMIKSKFSCAKIRHKIEMCPSINTKFRKYARSVFRLLMSAEEELLIWKYQKYSPNFLKSWINCLDSINVN